MNSKSPHSINVLSIDEILPQNFLEEIQISSLSFKTISKTGGCTLLEALLPQGLDSFAWAYANNLRGQIYVYESDHAGYQLESLRPADCFGQIIQCAGRGATLVFNEAEKISLGIAHVCNYLSRQMGRHCSANLYATPSNYMGFAHHKDTHDIIVMQLAGSKAWHIGEGSECGVAPLLMAPGDILFVRAATSHSAVAGNNPSIHVTFGLHGPDLGDLLNLLPEMLFAARSELQGLPIMRLPLTDKDAIRELTQALAQPALHQQAFTMFIRHCQQLDPLPAPQALTEALNHLGSDRSAERRLTVKQRTADTHTDSGRNE
jgi:hypothetical protein